ncbi:MAG: hypothetical protein KY453_05665, partial [Gemmatimonadetes bacterium]|nr:hypothetical protein [Gemmatimonadota bacterium]
MAMEVQVFGTKGCLDTRKALRFFSERRVKTHFVDLRQRAASPGELRRFVQRLGADALVDRESKRFRAKGLHQAHYGPDRWIEILAEEPLEFPLVTAMQRAGDLQSADEAAAWQSPRTGTPAAVPGDLEDVILRRG